MCFKDEDAETACWVDDSRLDQLPDGIVISSVEFFDDTNNDGQLNPGDNNARVLVYIRNATKKKVDDIVPWLEERPTDIEIEYCGSGSHTFEYDCDFRDHYDSSISLEPGELGDDPALYINFGLSEMASQEPIEFTVGFQEVDIAGDNITSDSWIDSFTLEVEP